MGLQFNIFLNRRIGVFSICVKPFQQDEMSVKMIGRKSKKIKTLTQLQAPLSMPMLFTPLRSLK